MNEQYTSPNRRPGPRYEVRTRVRAMAIPTVIATGLGLAIVVAAAFVPVVTVQSAPVSTVAPSGDLPAAVTVSTPALTSSPRVTLLAQYGVSALGVAAIPLLAAIIVGLLLYRGIVADSRTARAAAASLSAALTAAGVVGFVTILIGVFVVPVGILLLVACKQSAPPPPGTAPVSTLWVSSPW